MAGFDKSKDKCVKKYDPIPLKNTVLVLAYHSYDGGTPKLRISRMDMEMKRFFSVGGFSHEEIGRLAKAFSEISKEGEPSSNKVEKKTNNLPVEKVENYKKGKTYFRVRTSILETFPKKFRLSLKENLKTVKDGKGLLFRRTSGNKETLMEVCSKFGTTPKFIPLK